MSRNDSVLNTGLSSAIDRRLAERRKAERKEQEHVRAKLRPEAEVILDAIDKEREWVREKIVLLPLDFVTHKDDLSAYLLACQMHLEWTMQFKNTMKAILKLRADKEQPDGQ